MSPYINTNVDQDNDLCQSNVRDVFSNIDDNPDHLPLSLDPFTVTTKHGFLPFQPPLVQLPPAFKPLSTLLDQMPIVKIDGQPGLLATCQLGPYVDSGDALPDLTNHLDHLVCADGKHDLAAITAVFRDYSFLASAYLLEPCWEYMSQGSEGSELGRELLPRCIAGPLVKAATILDIPPFMSYAGAYALYNYRYADPTIATSEYGNLRLIRAFERGLDPTSSEAGFILTHVDMVSHTSGLVRGAFQVLNSVPKESSRDIVNEAFNLLLETMQVIETSMENMWAHSKPKDYLTYRTFLFGITNQSMFPNGVIYEGINDNQPMSFRGESGANDAIIPLLDALLEIPMPKNPLTDILKDFRNYRPKPHREFLAYVRQQASEVGVAAYCCKDLETTVLYLRLLEHVRSFRWRHGLFAREYIIKRTSHPTASGGSPIITWLPNQLFAVMALMARVWADIPDMDRITVGKDVVEMMSNVRDQNDKLQKEVQRYCQERGS